jgi:light-regulated signal transduction histidine kinase (bacteriophytochrome)
VSHDLRRPLSSIDGFSKLLGKALAKTVGDPLSERSQHYLARIQAGVRQMGDLVDALLSLAHVTHTPLRSELVDVSALAEDLLNDAKEREPGRATRLQVQAGMFAQGDPRLLRQVLDNLLGNAWKFSARKALTEITFGHETDTDGETVYVVRDNGAGFDMVYSDKLFSAFQRLHSLTEFAGTGIGLVTVQRIVMRHGGKVWATSAPNEGAAFHFTLGRFKAQALSPSR